MDISTGHSEDGGKPTQFWLQNYDHGLRLYQMEILTENTGGPVKLNCYFNKQLISSCEVDVYSDLSDLLEHFSGFVQELDDEYSGHADRMNELIEVSGDGDMGFHEFAELFYHYGIPIWAASLFAADVRPISFEEMCGYATTLNMLTERGKTEVNKPLRSQRG